MGAEGLLRRPLRGLVLLLAASSLADPRGPRRGLPPTPVAILDVSASVGGTGELPSGAEVGGIRLLVADGVLAAESDLEAAALPRGATRLAEALRQAAGRWPGRDVWLLTDGRGTDGDVGPAASALAALGGRVFTSPPTRPAADAGWLDGRAEGAAGRAVTVRGTLASSTDGDLRLVLARGDVPVAAREVRVAAGDRRVVELEDRDAPAEGAVYELRLEALAGTPDDDPGNDRLRVAVRPARRVVWLWGGLAPSLLRGDRASAPVVRASAAPEVSGLAAADLLVVSGVPWEEIGTRTALEVARFVAGGGRLLLLGGPRAYAAGGWAGTPLEERLAPLRVPRVEGRGRALVLALDRSGSTAGAPLAALVRAAREAADLLAPTERLAVLPFAATPDPQPLAPGWVRPGDAAALDRLRGALADVVAGGATDLPAAVRGAAALASAARDVGERRVVLLTDGDPDHPPSPEELAALRPALDAADVRFGALVVGDAEMAARLRATLARDPEDVAVLGSAAELPSALARAREAMRREGETVEGPAALAPVGEGHAGLALGDYEPRRLHRLEVAEGAEAFAVARSRGGEETLPFGARRAVGAGLVVALAFGPEGEPDPAAAAAWLLPLVEGLAAEGDRGVAAGLEGDRLAVSWPEAAGSGSLRAAAGGFEALLVEAAPGRFVGPAPAGEAADLRVRPSGDRGLAPRSVRLPARPPPEHAGVGVEEGALAAIAAAGNGRRLADGERPPAAGRPPGPPLAPWLLLAAGILLVVDRAGSARRQPMSGRGARPPS